MISKVKNPNFERQKIEKMEHVLSRRHRHGEGRITIMLSGYLPSPFNFFVTVESLTPVTIHRTHFNRCNLQFILIGFFVIRYITIVDQTFAFLKAMPGYFFQH